MINVLALYADKSGCGDYRVRFPAAAVNSIEDKFGVHVETSDHFNGEAIKDGVSVRIKRIDIPRGIDVVSVQRPLAGQVAGAVKWLREHRPDIGIHVDLDDDLANVPTSNQAFFATHPKYSPEQNYRWLRQTIALADVFTCSTPEIAQRYGYDQDRTHVIRNAVPESMLQQPSRALGRKPSHAEENRDRVIGWAGSVSTHGGDLDTMSGALADIVGVDRTDGRNVRFRNVGPKDGLSEALGLREVDMEASGWLSPEMYRVAMGELDVGLVPLADTRFNRAKSYLKAIEFAAAGVPVIASKTPEHEALVRSGVPIWLVKNRRRDWVRAIRSILDLDDKELKNLAHSHRQSVASSHTMTHRATQWATAWRQAAEISKKLQKGA